MTTTSKATAQTMTTDTVTAEDAPIGVLLWPVTHAAFAPNYTLARVETVRNAAETFVRWVYEGGHARTFRLGEQVAVRYTA